MTTKEFNPALPYTFENTEEDKRELRKVLIEWCEITDHFQNAFKGLGQIINGYQITHWIRWNTALSCHQWVDHKNQEWVDSVDFPMPVVYTPPEAIKVIMSGERFVLDEDSCYNTYFSESNQGIICYIDSVLNNFRVGLKDFLSKKPNWHTATLCDEVKLEESLESPKLADEKKPRVFKDIHELIQFCNNNKSYIFHFSLLINFTNGHKSKYTGVTSHFIQIGLHYYLQAAFDSGATVELVEG